MAIPDLYSRFPFSLYAVKYLICGFLHTDTDVTAQMLTSLLQRLVREAFPLENSLIEKTQPFHVFPFRIEDNVD
jgi:hypothetical protein